MLISFRDPEPGDGWIMDPTAPNGIPTIPPVPLRERKAAGGADAGDN